MNESKKAITRFAIDGRSLGLAEAKALNRRLAKSDAMPIDYADVPELSDVWFLQAARTKDLASPPAKKPISIKLDEDVLGFFKSEGSRYQTHINAVLRAYMQARQIVKSNN